MVIVVILIAGRTPWKRSNPARASTRQGARGSLSEASMVIHSFFPPDGVIKICTTLKLAVENENLIVQSQRKAQKVDIEVKCWWPLKIGNSKLPLLYTKACTRACTKVFCFFSSN